MMSNDDVISQLEEFAKEQRESAKKGVNKTTLKTPLMTKPWALLDDGARVYFDDVCNSEYQSELRKERGIQRGIDNIRTEKWNSIINSSLSNLVRMKITDENINAAFELYTKDEIINKLLDDEIFFKLSERQLHRDCVEYKLSQHNEIMLEVIREATTIKAELYKMALVEVDEIIADYEVNHAS